MCIFYFNSGSPNEFFLEGKQFSQAKFYIDGMGTNEEAENKNKTAKSLNIFSCILSFYGYLYSSVAIHC